ncbi:MAG: serine/threonine-protein kinase, partial [Polyangiaceae bacterium]
RPTAIKLVPPEKAGPQQLVRFEREVQHTAELQHPNTIQIFDYGHSPDGVFYYAMEFLDGIDLDDLVERDGPQPPGRVVHILEQACAALAEAHAKGLVHRDIKPANMFLCHRGGIPDVVKVLDFGLVKELATEGGVTNVDVVAGTPAYLSPEAITAPDTLGPSADIYALGAVGYFLLTGEPVFSGATVVEICGHHVHSAPEPPSRRSPLTLSDDLEAVILRCLAKKPEERPPDVRELRRALRSLPESTQWDDEQAEAWWAEAPRKKRSGAGTGAPETMDIDLRARA